MICNHLSSSLYIFIMKGSLGLGYLNSTYFSTKQSLILRDVFSLLTPHLHDRGELSKVCVICWASCLEWLREQLVWMVYVLESGVSCRRLAGETLFLCGYSCPALFLILRAEMDRSTNVVLRLRQSL